MKRGKVLGFLFAILFVLFGLTLAGCKTKSNEDIQKEVKEAYKDVTKQVYEENFQLGQNVKDLVLTFAVKEGSEKYLKLENNNVVLSRPAYTDVPEDVDFVKAVITYTANNKLKTTGELEFKIKKMPISVVEEVEQLLQTSVFGFVSENEYYNDVLKLAKKVKLVKNPGVEVELTWKLSEGDALILTDKSDSSELRKALRLEGGDKNQTLTLTYKIGEQEYKKEVVVKTQEDVKYNNLKELQDAIKADETLVAKLSNDKKVHNVILNNIFVYAEEGNNLFFGDTKGNLIFAYGGATGGNIATGKKLKDYKENLLLVSASINQRYGSMQIKIIDVIKKHAEGKPVTEPVVSKITDLVEVPAPKTGDFLLNKPIRLTAGEGSELLLTVDFADKYGNRFYDKAQKANEKQRVMVYYQSNMEFLQKRIVGDVDVIEYVDCILSGYRSDKECWYVSFLTNAKKIADCTELKMKEGYNESNAENAIKALKAELKFARNEDVNLAALPEFNVPGITFQEVAEAEKNIKIDGTNLKVTEKFEIGKIKNLAIKEAFKYREVDFSKEVPTTILGFNVTDLNLKDDFNPTLTTYNNKYKNYELKFLKFTEGQTVAQPSLALKNDFAKLHSVELTYAFPYTTDKEEKLVLALTFYKADGTEVGVKEVEIPCNKKTNKETVNFDKLLAPADAVRFTIGLSKKHTKLDTDIKVRILGVTVYCL